MNDVVITRDKQPIYYGPPLPGTYPDDVYNELCRYTWRHWGQPVGFVRGKIGVLNTEGEKQE